MNSSMYRNLTITALLMALAIMIPIMMPLKVVIPPASYTLASHVPIFLACSCLVRWLLVLLSALR